jgi:hypothetical protein
VHTVLPPAAWDTVYLTALHPPLAATFALFEKLNQKPRKRFIHRYSMKFSTLAAARTINALFDILHNIFLRFGQRPHFNPLNKKPHYNAKWGYKNAQKPQNKLGPYRAVHPD